MAHGQEADPNLDIIAETLKNYTCSVCLDIYDKPVHINCDHRHVYCQDCVRHYLSQDHPTCPQCREIFDPRQTVQAKDLTYLMRQNTSACKWCSQEIVISKLKNHMLACSKQDDTIPQFKPIAETKQLIPSNLPNRATFKCPLCGMNNLACSDLVRHCNEKHQQESSNCVCPVCASMPWGDPNLKSLDFIQHLNLRHKFEYDTYVDFEQDDDEMLRRALTESLQEY